MPCNTPCTTLLESSVIVYFKLLVKGKMTGKAGLGFFDILIQAWVWMRRCVASQTVPPKTVVPCSTELPSHPWAAR